MAGASEHDEVTRDIGEENTVEVIEAGPGGVDCWTTKFLAKVEVVEEVATGSEKDDTCGTKVIKVRPPVKVVIPESAKPVEDVISDEETTLLLVLTLFGARGSKLSLSDSSAMSTESLQVER